MGFITSMIIVKYSLSQITSILKEYITLRSSSCITHKFI